MKKLENKSVFITGGLSGIGLACSDAFIFLASDDRLFITGTSMEIEGGYLAQ